MFNGNADIPGVKADMPGVKADIPGVKADIPGVKADIPGVKADMPGVKADIPGVKADIPGVKADIPGVVNARVKELQISRFKVITLITIGSSNDQGKTVGSRCFWDASVDMLSSFEYKNKHLFAAGTVYGICAE
ncbi:dynein light chain Tctex-type 5-B-like [Watersipora subatra]|uniref:dynein light chain Tctex-type 5-B-like n=1 Tax=Watersipora subatra TaxID=2589382 RepID=UPI00355B97F1